MYGHNLASVRAHNRGAVVRLLHQYGPLSRREIACRSGLDASTITHIVADFLGAALARECSLNPPNDVPRRGRREIGIDLVPDAAFGVGVHVGLDQVRVGVCDLRGQVLGRRLVPRQANSSPDQTLRQIARLVDELIAETGVPRERVTGVGVGVIAFVNPNSGVVLSAPSLGWDEVAIVDPLGAELGLPVLLDHHVRAMALAEHWFGHARQMANFALVRVDSSIGIGLVIDGQLLRGDGFHAGQIAHLIVAEDGPLCSCGRKGCLVMLGSYRAIAARARAISANQPASVLARMMLDHPDVPPEQVVFHAARLGEPIAASLIAEAAEHIARTITDIATILDPKMIVFSVGQPEHEATLIPPLRHYLEAHAPPYRGGVPEIIGSALGPDLPILGAATLALERVVVDPEWYRTRPTTDLRARTPVKT
ncbi:MAG TPA: ROK family transcriptional regulator, partial [Chloroflexota bacterium]|nr:ROK family transcriptional regulator [Chloroflexota bacterium]